MNKGRNITKVQHWDIIEAHLLDKDKDAKSIQEMTLIPIQQQINSRLDKQQEHSPISSVTCI